MNHPKPLSIALQVQQPSGVANSAWSVRGLAATLLSFVCSQILAADLIIDTPGNNPIAASTTVDEFWIGENTPGVLVTINSGVTVTVNTGHSCVLGINTSSSGNSLTISDTGFLVGADNLNVGYSGPTNTVTVAAGGTANVDYLNMGVNSTSTGNVVNIAGMLTTTANINLGYGAGNQTLNVQTGGQLTNSGDAAIGLVLGANGNSANVTGPAGVWTSTGTFYAGYASSLNTVNLTLGGKVIVDTSAKDVLIGAEPGANGNQILVTGLNSELSNRNATLYVGRSGNNNRLDIQKNGLVSSRNVRIGGGTGGTGNPTGNGAYVDGVGSIWNITGTLRVGAGTVGTDSGLEITNGGVVNVTGNSFMGYDPSSDGNHVLVDGAASQLNLNALVLGGVNLSEGSVNNVLTLANGGTLQATTIDVRESNEVAFGSGGGAITATTLNSKGMLSAAAGSTGTITGDYNQDPLGTYRTHIADNTTFGKVHVTGNVAMTAPAKLNVRVADCAQVIPPATFLAIFSATNNLPVNTFKVTDNCPGLLFTAQLSNDGKAIDLTVVTDPAGGAANQHCRFFGNCQ